MPGAFSPPPPVSNPDIHHGTRVTHVPWCKQGSLTSGFIWSRWRGNVPDIPGACATQNFTYLVRGPCGECNWHLDVCGVCHTALMSQHLSTCTKSVVNLRTNMIVITSSLIKYSNPGHCISVEHHSTSPWWTIIEFIDKSILKLSHCFLITALYLSHIKPWEHTPPYLPCPGQCQTRVIPHLHVIFTNVHVTSDPKHAVKFQVHVTSRRSLEGRKFEMNNRQINYSSAYEQNRIEWCVILLSFEWMCFYTV